MTGDIDPYKILQVDPRASQEVLQAAYRALARLYHPDVASGPKAATRMVEINTAWEMIRDPERRAEYDRSRALDGSPGGPPGFYGATTPGWGSVAGGWGGGTPWAAGHSGPAGSAGPPAHTTSGPGGTRFGTSGGAPAGPGPSPAGPLGARSRMGGVRGSQDQAQWRSGPAGVGAAGPPPGKPSGSVLDFGRHIGWSVGEIARVDPGYLVWLEGRPEGKRYRAEIETFLRRMGVRKSTEPPAGPRKGGFFNRG